jgi:uncharacterized protein (DUF1800 family)
MPRLRGVFALAGMLFACGGAAEKPSPAAPASAAKPIPATPAPTTSDAAHRLLSRLSFGPRPEDLSKVRKLGALPWLEAQLAPEKIPDARAEAAVAPYRAALLPPLELAEHFSGRELDAEMLPKKLVKEIDFKELVATAELAELTRHVTSERQVSEVMVDFWTNHFNVFARKGLVKLFAADFVERVIRPRALGKFEDLLIATAQHPAMLLYLDNARSDSRRGLNENYARELLELHTLGVDGGYTQADVVEVARILTGWSVRRPRDGGLGFLFRERAHDSGEKTVLGTRYPAGGGQDEGLALLRALARHPSTAAHLGKKLCARFVADAPPKSCIDRVAKAYRDSNGDVRELVRAIVKGPELWAHSGDKLKTPLEFLASALRALGAEPDGTLGLARVLGGLGEPILLQPVPTGYPEAESAWTSSGALLARMNTATALGAGRLPGVTFDLDRVLPLRDDPDAMVAAVNARVLGGRGSARTLEVMRREASDLPDPDKARALAVALALASPEFQRQ